MRTWMSNAVVGIALGSLGAMAWAAGPLAAKVNGVEITVEDVEKFNNLVAEKKGFKLKPAAAAEQLIVLELLAQEGVRQGKDKRLPKNELASAVFSEYAAANQLSEEDLRKEYQRAIALHPKKVEHKVQGIVVKTEQQAKDILVALDAGKSFASLAEQSIDEKSKSNGGDMGWFELDDLDNAWSAALQGLKPGTYYKKPVYSAWGYAVVRLDEVRAVGVPSYEELRDQVVAKMGADRREALMKPLRDNAKIERFPGYEAPKVHDATNRSK